MVVDRLTVKAAASGGSPTTLKPRWPADGDRGWLSRHELGAPHREQQFSKMACPNGHTPAKCLTSSRGRSRSLFWRLPRAHGGLGIAGGRPGLVFARSGLPGTQGVNDHTAEYHPDDGRPWRGAPGSTSTRPGASCRPRPTKAILEGAGEQVHVRYATLTDAVITRFGGVLAFLQRR